MGKVKYRLTDALPRNFTLKQIQVRREQMRNKMLEEKKQLEGRMIVHFFPA